jgi:hypothetical protein
VTTPFYKWCGEGGHGQVKSILTQCEELAFTVAWQGLPQDESRIGSDNDVFHTGPSLIIAPSQAWTPQTAATKLCSRIRTRTKQEAALACLPMYGRVRFLLPQYQAASTFKHLGTGMVGELEFETGKLQAACISYHTNLG